MFLGKWNKWLCTKGRQRIYLLTCGQLMVTLTRPMMLLKWRQQSDEIFPRGTSARAARWGGRHQLLIGLSSPQIIIEVWINNCLWKHTFFFGVKDNRKESLGQRTEHLAKTQAGRHEESGTQIEHHAMPHQVSRQSDCSYFIKMPFSVFAAHLRQHKEVTLYCEPWNKWKMSGWISINLRNWKLSVRSSQTSKQSPDLGQHIPCVWTAL